MGRCAWAALAPPRRSTALSLSVTVLLLVALPLPAFAVRDDSDLSEGDHRQEVTLKVEGEAAEVRVDIKAEAVVEVATATLFPVFLAPRPTQDFGYVFFMDKFTLEAKFRLLSKEKHHHREKEHEHEYQPLFSSDVFAVVSCGQLRFLNVSVAAMQNPLDRIKMDPALGQYELNLTNKSFETWTVDSDNAGCLTFKVFRPAGGWFVPGETKLVKLCSISSSKGKKSDVKKLEEAVKLQLRRFQDTRAASWNYGTHPADKVQYRLPGGSETTPLTQLMEEGFSSSVDANSLAESSTSALAMAGQDAALAQTSAEDHSNFKPLHQEKAEEKEVQRGDESQVETHLVSTDDPGKRKEEESAQVSPLAQNSRAGLRSSSRSSSSSQSQSQGQGQSESIILAPGGTQILQKAELEMHQQPKVAREVHAHLPPVSRNLSLMQQMTEPAGLSVSSSSSPSMLKSEQRRACYAEHELDTKYFPPGKHPDAMLRLSLPEVADGKDAFVLVEKLEITEVEMRLTITRKEKNVFSISLHGHETDKPGSIHGYVHGVKVHTHSEKAEADTKLVTYDKGEVDADVRVSADFKFSPESAHWSLVEPSMQKQEIEIRFGSGPEQDSISKYISESGKLDKVFLDSLWPLVENALPPVLGHALDVSDAKIDYKLRVHGKCKGLAPGTKQCSSDMLELRIEGGLAMEGDAERIISKYLESAFTGDAVVHLVGDSTAASLRKIVMAYHAQRPVFQGSDMSASASVRMEPSKRLDLKLSGAVDLTADLFSIALKDVAQAVGDFVPPQGKGALAFEGLMQLQNGVIVVPDGEIDNLLLPIALEEGDKRVFILNVKTKNCKIQCVSGRRGNSGAAKGLADIMAIDLLSPDSPLHLSRPMELMMNLGSTRGIMKGDDLSGYLSEEYVKHMLVQMASTSLVGSTRTAKAEEADGVVPRKFERPFVRPATELLVQQLQGMTLDAKAHLLGGDGTNRNVNIALSYEGEIEVNKPSLAIKGLFDHHNVDYGYVHYAVDGKFGNCEHMCAESGKIETAKAQLDCGILEIITHDQIRKVDVLSIAKLELLDMKTGCTSASQKGGSSTCMLVQGGNDCFCSDTSELRTLVDGLELQKTRFNDAAVKAGQDQNMQDATWFKASFLPQYPPT